MAFLPHTQNVHASLAHPTDRGAFPLSPRLCKSLLGGDEKALKESHPKSQSREPMATTGCRPGRRHSWSPVTSGTLRMRIRPLEAVPAFFAHASVLGAAACKGRQHLNLPPCRPSLSSGEDLAVPAPTPVAASLFIHSFNVVVNTSIQIVAGRLLWVLIFGCCGKPS